MSQYVCSNLAAEIARSIVPIRVFIWAKNFEGGKSWTNGLTWRSKGVGVRGDVLPPMGSVENLSISSYQSFPKAT